MKKILLLILFPIIGFSQNAKENGKIIEKTKVTTLNTFAKTKEKSFFENKKRAVEFSKIYNWPLKITKEDTYSELVGITPDNKPVYYMTSNHGAGITARANKLYTGGDLGLDVNGENMTAGVWDAGSALFTHEIFTGRVQLMDASSSHYHSAHVAGTIIGTDQVENGLAKGMAYKGSVRSYDWNDDVAEVATAAAAGLLFSNHSYGYGFVDEYQFGKYDINAQDFDEIMYNAPYYQFVCAAGNKRGSENLDKNGYDLLTGHATSKNGISVAAVNEVLDYTGPSSVVMSQFSSWGSTDDGRIKPDISAKGVDTYSATDASTTSYDTFSGTSMASPSVAGTLMLFQQYYNQLNASFMRASTVRGLMIHTADEAGVSPGPDYAYGWGLINAEKAADVITKKQVQSYILENVLNQGSTFNINVNALGTEPLKATLCWTDPKGNIPSNTIDEPTPNLINDLDIRISQVSTTSFPWKLDPANPSSPATMGDNVVDNVEKIELNNPTGSYVVSVSHKGLLLNNLQNYSLIISGISIKDFWFTSNQISNSFCNGQNSKTFAFNLHTKSNFKETVTYSALNLPLGVTATFNPISMTAAGSFALTLSGLTSLTPGKYEIIVKGQTASDFFEMPFSFTVLTPSFNPIALSNPTNTATSVGIPTTFDWVADVNAQQYTIEIANNSNFSHLLITDTVGKNQYIANSGLNNNTTYYWRVRPKNNCGVGDYSSTYSFTTVCSSPSATTLTDTTTSSATIGWTDNSGATSWEVIVVPQGTSPGNIGTVITTNSYTISGLLSNTCYDFYLRSICSNGTSSWINPFPFCTQPDFCAGDHFYDTGRLSGNYKNNENYVKTIYPDNTGDRIKAIFNSFEIEEGWDFLNIYDGPDITYPLLANATGVASPKTIVATNNTGALTFEFISDQTVTMPGWDATIVCEPMPPCLNPPTNVSFLNSTLTTASFNWTENSGSTSWEYQLVPQGSTPGSSGTITTTKMITGLSVNTCYDFYVRSVCSAGNSDWSGPVSFCTSPDYCAGDHFYDTGGASGNYQDSESYIRTIYPTNVGDRVKAIFNSFQLENCCDYLTIYNGPDSSYPVLFTGSGSKSPGTIKSTQPTGALTFRFYSDSSVTHSGWDATIVCEPMPPCPNPPTNVSFLNSTLTTASFNWTENSGSTSWEYQLVPQGSTPGSSGTITTTKMITGLSVNTCYDFYVRSVCSAGNSDWSGPVSFCTSPDYCAGDHFYDTGGASGNYQDSESYIKTIYPDVAGDHVSVIFNSFQTESCCDYLKIYNGSSVSSPLLFIANGSVSPGSFTSTDSTGALTFEFYSDISVTATGWDVTVICQKLGVGNSLEWTEEFRYYPNPVDNHLNIESEVNIKNYSVFDVNMRLIGIKKINSPSFSIDLSSYGSGIYFIKVFAEEDKSKMLKIIRK